MNKKGIFFTTLSIILVSIVIIAFVATTQNRTQDAIEINNIRVETASSFVNFLEETQFQRALETSTNYALSSFSNYIEDNKNYLPEGNVSIALFEAVIGVPCGDTTSYNFLSKKPSEILNYQPGVTQGVCDNVNNYEQYMTPTGFSSEQSFTGILNDINSLALESGINFNYIINNVNFELIDEWTIKAVIDLDYKIVNSDNTISFNKKNIHIEKNVPITDQRDPIYTKNSYIKFIKKDSNALINEVLPWLFVSNPNNVPDYFQRLTGQLDKTSQFGIQSVFNPNAYAPTTGRLGSKSFVDYIYLGSISTPGRCQKVGNAYVNLDDINIAFYNGKGVPISDCPINEFVDCTDETKFWKNADPLNCGITCPIDAPLLIIRYCGNLASPVIETKCVLDDGTCSGNCARPDHCGDGILNKVCEKCEPAPGVICNPNTCQ